MDWIKRLNQAIDFIEKNLDGELDYEDVAGVAGCPSYYFQQMFLYMTDMTLREYIRRRRLSLSAVELQKENGKVTDIAMKYGYESPTAFTRAFKNFHGITPSAEKRNLYLFRHIRRFLFPWQSFERIPTVWDAALAEGTLTRLISMSDGKP